MKKRWSVGLPITAFALSAIYLLVMPLAKLPLNSANGTYANHCCGTVELRDGIMSFRNHEISYVIEKDKGGAYLLPRAYVGVLPGHGLYIARNKNVLKLRLDEEEQSESISIVGADSREYSFTR